VDAGVDERIERMPGVQVELTQRCRQSRRCGLLDGGEYLQIARDVLCEFL